MKNTLKIATFLLTYLLFTSCSKPKYIGKWQEIDSKVQVDLGPDGIYQIADGKEILRGKYEVTKEGKLKIQFDDKGITTILEYYMHADSDSMKITDYKAGKWKNYTRIQSIE